MLTVGDKFPIFNLMASNDLPFEQINMDNAFKTITNSTYSGKWKLIFFYPKDFTFVCPTEIIAFANMFDDFRQRNTQILGCSVDSEFVHWAWRKHNPGLRKLPFPLMSDLKRELSGALGILCNDSGVARRALFIVDPDNIIRFVMVTDMNVGRNPEEALRVLDALQTGELCQCGWIRGQKTIDPDEYVKSM
jgi:peroxiredoxin (alkyl hydroperoxide reductase subunit C)